MRTAVVRSIVPFRGSVRSRSLAIAAIGAAVAVVAFATSAASSTTQHWVRAEGGTLAESGAGLSCDEPGYRTIGAAIAAASAGDTINVCSGTYSGALTITKRVALKGPFATTSPVKDDGTADLAWVGTPATIVGGSSGAVITMSSAADGTTIEGFAITSSLTSTPSSYGPIGINSQGPDDVTIKNNHFYRLYDVAIYNTSGTGNRWLISQNLITNPDPFDFSGTTYYASERAGINPWYLNDLVISGNRIDGYGRGMQLETNSRALVEDNHVSNVFYHGIQAANNQTDTVIRNNIVDRSQLSAVYVDDFGLSYCSGAIRLWTVATSSGFVVEDNLITNTGGELPGRCPSIAATSAQNPGSVASIARNRIADPEGIGIGWTATQIASASLTGNVATVTTAGVNPLGVGDTVAVANLGEPFDGTWTVASKPSALTFTFARTAPDVVSFRPAPLDGASAVEVGYGTIPAGGNWWGSPGGPGAPGASSSAGGTSIVVAPWCSDATCETLITPALSGFTPGAGKAGDTVTVSGTALSGTQSVTFGTVPATSFTVVDDSTVTAVVPNGGSGAITVGLRYSSLMSAEEFTASSVLWVNNDEAVTTVGNGGTSCAVPGYTTLGAAITAASAGDTIEVCPGTYTENVTVNKAVDIRGPFADTSPIGAGLTPVWSGDQAIVRASSGTVITVSAAASIKGLSITSTNGATTPSAVGPTGIWLFCPGASGAIIQNNHLYELYGDGISYAVGTCGPNPSEFRATGITIDSNLITQPDPLAVNGSYDARPQAGIRPWYLGGITISNNRVDGFGFGIQLQDNADPVVKSNRVSNTAVVGIQMGTSITGALIKGNTVDLANRLLISDRGGIIIFPSATSSGITVENNAVTNSYNGITLRDQAAAPLPADLVIRNNSLDASNSNAGVFSGAAASGTVDASGNWWGAADGPGTTGASVVKLNPSGGRPVSTSPWIASFTAGSAPAGFSSSIGFWPSVVVVGQPCTSECYVDATTGSDDNPGTAASPLATIQKAVELVSADGTVNVAAGTYSGDVDLTKELDLLCANAGVSAGTTPGTRGAETVITGTVDVRAAGTVIDGCSFVRPDVGRLTASPRIIESIGVSGEVTVRNSIIDLAVPGTSPVQRGCGAGTHGTAAWRIHDNALRNGQYNGCSLSVQYDSRMVWAENAQPIEVRRNVFDNVQQSIYLTGSQPSGSVVEDNTFVGLATAGPFIGIPSDVVIRGNRFEGYGGVYLDSSTGTVIEGNVFASSNWFAVWTAGAHSGVVVRENEILGGYPAGNGDYTGRTVFNFGAATLDARENWWGTIDGPLEKTRLPLNVGAIQTAPWCGEATCDTDALLYGIVSSVSPSSASPGTTVTITGVGFKNNGAPVSEVRFGTAVSTSVNVVSDTLLYAVVPGGGDGGPTTITLDLNGGTASSSTPIEVVVPLGLLKIDSFSPLAAAPGSVIRVNGAGFDRLTTVVISGIPATFRTIGTTAADVTVPAGAASNGPVTFTTPVDLVISTTPLTVVVPTVSSLSTGTAQAGEELVISGSNLLGATRVTFGGGKVVSVLPSMLNGSGTQLTVTVPSGAETGAVVVTNRLGNAVNQPSLTVTVPLAITQPRTIPELGWGERLTLSGTRLDEATEVTVTRVTTRDGDGQPLTQDAPVAAVFTSGSGGTSLTVTLPSGIPAGAQNVTVRAGGTTVATILIDVRAPTDPAPTISSVARNRRTGIVTVNGTGFLNVISVEFSGPGGTWVAASSPRVVGTTAIEVAIPVGAITGPVRVTTFGGTVVSSGSLTVPSS